MGRGEGGGAGLKSGLMIKAGGLGRRGKNCQSEGEGKGGRAAACVCKGFLSRAKIEFWAKYQRSISGKIHAKQSMCTREGNGSTIWASQGPGAGTKGFVLVLSPMPPPLLALLLACWADRRGQKSCCCCCCCRHGCGAKALGRGKKGGTKLLLLLLHPRMPCSAVRRGRKLLQSPLWVSKLKFFEAYETTAFCDSGWRLQCFACDEFNNCQVQKQKIESHFSFLLRHYF